MWLAARIFVLGGVLFGLIFGSVRHDVSVGVIGGVVFGLVMATVLTATSAARTRSDATLRTRQAADVVTELSVDEARAHLLGALQTMRAKIGQVDQWHIRARTRASWVSWGEIVTAQLSAPDGAVVVHLTSRPCVRTAITDYGKNAENVRRLVAALPPQRPSQAEMR